MHLLYIHLFVTSLSSSSSSSFLSLGKNEGIVIPGNIEDEVLAHTSTNAARKKAILWHKMAKNKQSSVLQWDTIININRSQQQMDEINKNVIEKVSRYICTCICVYVCIHLCLYNCTFMCHSVCLSLCIYV